MARLIIALGVVLVASSSVKAQEATQRVLIGSDETDAAEKITTTEAVIEYEDRKRPQEADSDCLTNVYCKVVKGILWIEGTAGPAKFNVTRYRSFNLLGDVGTLQPNVVTSGAEYGAGIGAQLDVFSIGARFKYGKFDAFDMIAAGLDFGFLVKRVPFVHPYARFGLYYNTVTNGSPIPGLDQILEDHKVNGGSVALGAGIRIPVIKWLSVAIGFDYSWVALYVSGYDTFNAEDFGNGTIGGEIVGTFALTVHPI